MAEHENATRLRAGYAAFSSGDMEALNEFIPEDAVARDREQRAER